MAYSILASFSLLKGAKCLQEDMLGNVFHCPMNFFDTTPLGRILNRFSKDVDTIDNTLPLAIRQIIATLFLVMSTLFTISYTTPIFMSIIVPVAVLYYVIQVSVKFFFFIIRKTVLPMLTKGKCIFKNNIENLACINWCVFNVVAT